MKNNEIENKKNKKETTPMIKYRCEECQGILFRSNEKISQTIEIVCKTKRFNSKTSRNKTRCNYLNIIKGAIDE